MAWYTACISPTLNCSFDHEHTGSQSDWLLPTLNTAQPDFDWVKSRVPDQNGISQALYIVEIYHSGPEPLK